MGWFLLAGIACGLPDVADGDSHSDDTPAPVDADGDGYASDVDCNDDDAMVHPHAEEVCGNDVDESCLEGADDCLWSGTVAIAGTEIGSDNRGDKVGAPVIVCDVDADGQRDLVMAGPEMFNKVGAVYVFHGPLHEPRTIDAADYTLLGTGAWMAAGSSIDCGDVDGDGVADLFVGERGDEDAAPLGAAYVVSGDGNGSGVIDGEAAFAWRGEYASDLYGYQVAALEDGDGRNDVAITIWGSAVEQTLWGRTWVISEPEAGDDVVETAADASVYGSGEDDSIVGARTAGDLDADGVAELAVVRRNDAYGSKLDSLYVFDGPLIGHRPTEDADVTVTDTEPGFAHIVGHEDLDADGKTDLFVSNPDSEPNAVYVFLDALPVVTPAASAQVRIDCSRQSSRAGAAVLSPGDVSADGVGDLLVGASGEDAVYLIGGGEPGVYDLDDDAQAVLRGEHVGFSFAKGDVTGDGITDFVITDSSLTIGGSGVVVMPGFDL